MITIGFATIGESPRDDVVPAILKQLGPNTRAVERGCLDRLQLDEIEGLAPTDDEVGIITLLRSGASVLLSHRKILPRMQQCVDQLVHDEKANVVVILCGADWSAIRSERLVINPGNLFPAVVSSLALGMKLGIIKPSAGQVEQETARYASIGIDAVVTSASPYAGDDRLELARDAAQALADGGCDLVWMTCIGMDTRMREVVADVTQKPVILAQSLIASMVSQLTPGSGGSENA
jgi:protein AroM